MGFLGGQHPSTPFNFVDDCSSFLTIACTLHTCVGLWPLVGDVVGEDEHIHRCSETCARHHITVVHTSIRSHPIPPHQYKHGVL